MRERLAAPPAPDVPGDLNGDGKVNNRDALLLFRYVSGVPVKLTVPKQWLDVNKDGKINNKDALILFRYVSGILNSLP